MHGSMQKQKKDYERCRKKNEVVEIKNANRNEDKIEQNNPNECSKYIKKMKRSRNQLKKCRELSICWRLELFVFALTNLFV